MYGGIANNYPVIQKKKDCREAAFFCWVPKTEWIGYLNESGRSFS